MKRNIIADNSNNFILFYLIYKQLKQKLTIPYNFQTIECHTKNKKVGIKLIKSCWCLSVCFFFYPCFSLPHLILLIYSSIFLHYLFRLITSILLFLNPFLLLFFVHFSSCHITSYHIIHSTPIENI